MICWFCGQKTMEEASDLGSGWVRCPYCGATWIEVPVIATSPLVGTWRDAAGFPHFKAARVPKKLRAKK